MQLSMTTNMTSGIPQGSALSPLLFLMFDHDPPREINNPYFLFADNFKVAGTNVYQDLQAVIRWSEKWDLPLNLAKYQLLTAEAELDIQAVSVEHNPSWYILLEVL
ncbi:unnamed protein product [Echinostoma caproni]|uniref:Reverse transcriptase domain-containing protein n=1 Tax=Echinostoma caproni TaxID=27848 RepID=A0A183A2P2_9TREM|nr:unnamed protein product [Echinostoma caproni]